MFVQLLMFLVGVTRIWISILMCLHIWKGVIKFLSQMARFFCIFQFDNTYIIFHLYCENVVRNYITVSRLNMSKAGYNFISQKIWIFCVCFPNNYYSSSVLVYLDIIIANLAWIKDSFVQDSVILCSIWAILYVIVRYALNPLTLKSVFKTKEFETEWYWCI